MDDSGVGQFCASNIGISTWYKVEVLVAGTILATGRRIVRAVLRVMGLSQERNYAQYHQVLSRATWSGLDMSVILLRALLKAFDQGEPLVFGLDETIDRRRGDKISAKGIYPDPLRSSKAHFVNLNALRWISVM